MERQTIENWMQNHAHRWVDSQFPLRDFMNSSLDHDEEAFIAERDAFIAKLPDSERKWSIRLWNQLFVAALRVKPNKWSVLYSTPTLRQ